MLDHVHTDTDACYRAVQSRERRFDGVFVTAVRTTGIYCRPSCPAITPKRGNVTFHPSSAAAQAAGYRACKRCRPDATPGSAEWDVRADVVGRAMRLLHDGAVDRGGVPALAAQLGYSRRQLERLLQAELGAPPLALARAQRAQTARVLVETTDLPLADVAFAAGFGSVRQFNDTVREVFAMTPTELRATVRTRPARAAIREVGAEQPSRAGGCSGSTSRMAAQSSLAAPLPLRLPFRQPAFVDHVYGHLVATGVPGVEEWRDGSYRRTLRLPHGWGIAALRPTPEHVECELRLSDHRDLAAAVARCRRLLDLDADPVAVDEALSTDPALDPLVRKAPGRRLPRTVDPEELALRAVLGQQVSTAAARTHAGRLVQRIGTPVDDPVGGLTHLFPTAAEVAALDPADLALPAARKRTLLGLAAALADGSVDLGPGCDWAAARSALLALPGIGPWTTEVVAMRALGDPDAFPATDLGVLQGLRTVGAVDPDRWRPWRSYAVQHLWAQTDHAINQMPREDHP